MVCWTSFQFSVSVAALSVKAEDQKAIISSVRCGFGTGTVGTGTFLLAEDFELDPDPDPHPHQNNADPQPWAQLSKDCCLIL
jgi:hypothetical protein